MQVIVDEQTASVVLRFRQFGHQVARQFAPDVSLHEMSTPKAVSSQPTGRRGQVSTHSSPDQQPTRDLDDFFLLILHDDGLFLDLLYHGSREDVNLVLLERRFGELDEFLGVVQLGSARYSFLNLGEGWQTLVNMGRTLGRASMSVTRTLSANSVNQTMNN